jgi:hypothetical protein
MSDRRGCLRCSSGNGALRLVDGSSANKGRLQILLAGTWYNACSDFITGTTADKCCSYLGFKPSARRVPSSTFDPEGLRAREPNVFITYASCTDTDRTLIECSNVPPVVATNRTKACYDANADAALECQAWTSAVPPPGEEPVGRNAAGARTPQILGVVMAAVVAAMMMTATL